MRRDRSRFDEFVLGAIRGWLRSGDQPECAEKGVTKKMSKGGGVTDEILIAQNDDPELLEWLAKADMDGGGFLRSIARAALVADADNYPLLRPVILKLREKYPKYEPSEAVKQEIRERA